MGTALYVVREKVDKSGKEELKKHYGVPITSGQITTDHLAQEICERCSLTEGDVIAAVSALSDVMQWYLGNGNTVYLKGIGLFSVSASSEGCDTPDECTPGKVKAQRVCFKADNRMRSILENIKYCRIKRGRTK